MSRGRMDHSGILTFRPRVVFVRKKVAKGHQQEEYREKDNLVSNYEAISGPENETSTSKILGNKQEDLSESRKVGVYDSRKVVIDNEDKVVREDKLLNGKLLDKEKEKKIDREHSSKKEAVVHSVTQSKMFSVALSKEDTDLISRGGGDVIRKIEQITGTIIKISGHGKVKQRAFIRGSEAAVMKAQNIIKKEDVFINQGQVIFLLRDDGKRIRSIEKDSNAVIIIKGKSEDYMKPVTFIGTELAITIAKAILEEATIIQTKIMLDSEVGFLLRGGGKLINRIQKEAEVVVEFMGKRGDKGRVVNVIGSKGAVTKAWAMIQNAQFEK